MSVTTYDPDPITTAGNSKITVVSSIASITAPKLTELNVATSVDFQCATEAFGSSTDVSYTTRKMLCDKVATQKPGNRTYQMEALTIMMGDPQATTNAAYDALKTLDAIKYLVHRPGKDYATAYAVGDKVEVLKVQIASVDLRPISTSEGEEYAFTVAFAILDRTQLFGTLVA